MEHVHPAGQGPKHAPPAGPQTFSKPPGPHTPNASWQQVPLQGEPTFQENEHLPPMHAFSTGQSCSVSQPHIPFGRHTCPFAFAAQFPAGHALQDPLMQTGSDGSEH